MKLFILNGKFIMYRRRCLKIYNDCYARVNKFQDTYMTCAGASRAFTNYYFVPVVVDVDADGGGGNGDNGEYVCGNE